MKKCFVGKNKEIRILNPDSEYRIGVMGIKYLKSAAAPQDWPDPFKPEIAFAGRSNAGKSSLLNALYGSAIAKISQSPGKTRLLNFFDVDEKYRVVDMPGYGYSSRSGKEQMTWRQMIESFLRERPCLVGVIIVMDCRREWEEDEQLLLDWLNQIGLASVLVVSKIDKMNKSELTTYQRKIVPRLPVSNVFLTSTQNKTGVEGVEDYLYKEWIRPNLNKFKAKYE